MNPLAVITGGTKGIGRALAARFMAGGYDIITCARNAEQLAALQQEMQERYPALSFDYQAADLADRQAVNAFAAFITSKQRSPEVLINNTGVFYPGQIHNEPEGTLEKTIETNLYSAYYLTRSLLPGMMDQRKGHVFNICSTASITAYPNGGAYGISKFALHGMTKTLREEMKPYQVKVTAVLPGATLTDSWNGVDLPAERFIDPADVAEAVWAASQLSYRAVVEEILIRPQLGDLD